MTQALAPLSVFQFNTHPVRSVLDDQDDPWFVAVDVAAVLELGNVHSSLALLDDDEKGLHTMDTLGGPQAMITVNESGLYSMTLRSRKPQAKAFKRWITHDVLPAIRRTGGYVAPLSPREQALVLARSLVAAEERVAELEPIAAAATALVEAEGDFSVREAAEMLSRDHGIDTGQTRLFTKLRDLGWLDRKGMPYQRTIATGRLALKAGTYEHPHTGEPTLKHQVRVTPKGLLWLHEHWHDATSTP